LWGDILGDRFLIEIRGALYLMLLVEGAIACGVKVGIFEAIAF
jgi:hypothetical protein